MMSKRNLAATQSSDRLCSQTAFFHSAPVCRTCRATCGCSCTVSCITPMYRAGGPARRQFGNTWVSCQVRFAQWFNCGCTSRLRGLCTLCRARCSTCRHLSASSPLSTKSFMLTLRMYLSMHECLWREQLARQPPGTGQSRTEKPFLTDWLFDAAANYKLRPLDSVLYGASDRPVFRSPPCPTEAVAAGECGCHLDRFEV